MKAEPTSSQAAATTPAPGEFTPPSVDELRRHLPQLEILSLIGRGGMGAVYQARQAGLDRIVAVKILLPEISHDPSFAERFRREARALARLSHPNIVAIYDSGRAGDYFYFVMEYVEGANLREILHLNRITPADALSMVRQICDALQFAHEEGIIHRDIKPENILLDKKGRVKIADFGLAKLLSGPSPPDRLTRTQQVMGTPVYMAPEQIAGSQSIDHRADIYSLGVVFYELLTGELPVGKFEPPSQKAPVDHRLDQIVNHTLERDPELRYQQVRQVKTDVDALPDAAPELPEPPRDRPQIEPAKPQRAAGAWVIPLLGLLDIVVGVLLLFTTALVLLPQDGTDPLNEYWSRATPLPSLVERFNVIEPALGFIASAALFGAGVGLLMWKPWARRLAMGVCIYELTIFVISVPFLVLGAIVPLFRLSTDAAFQAAFDVSSGEVVLLTVVSLVSMVIFVTFLLVFHIAQLIILARPEVAQTFSRLPGLDAGAGPVPPVEKPQIRAALMQARSAARAPRWTCGLVTGGVLLVIGAVCCGLALLLLALVPHQWDSLTAAAARGDTEAVARFVQTASNLDLREPNGDTPLVVAAAAGHAKVVELLIGSGADIEARGAGDRTALGNALLHGRLSAARTLLEAGADVHGVDAEGRTILHLAAQSGDFACVQLVLKQQPTLDPNARAQAGVTPLMLAARSQNIATVRRLIEAGAVVDQQSDPGDTALMEAARRGNPGVVEALLAAGADARITNRNGCSALEAAVAGGYRTVIEQLLAAGAAQTASYNLWQGFQYALEGHYEQATPWFSAAAKQAPDVPSLQQLTLGEWMIETKYPEQLALACLAECELKCGNHQAAQQHYQKLQQRLSPATELVVAVRLWPSPAVRPADWSEQENSIYIKQSISTTALEQALAAPEQAVKVSFVRRAVETIRRGDGSIRNEQTSSGATEGLFE